MDPAAPPTGPDVPEPPNERPTERPRPDFLTVEEAAALLRCSPRTIRTWTRQGKLPHVEGLGRKLLYSRAALLRFGLPPNAAARS